MTFKKLRFSIKKLQISVVLRNFEGSILTLSSVKEVVFCTFSNLFWTCSGSVQVLFAILKVDFCLTFICIENLPTRRTPEPQRSQQAKILSDIRGTRNDFSWGSWPKLLKLSNFRIWVILSRKNYKFKRKSYSKNS